MYHTSTIEEYRPGDAQRLNALGLFGWLWMDLRPCFSLIPKGRTAKIVRGVVHAVAKILGTSDLQIALCREIVSGPGRKSKCSCGSDEWRPGSKRKQGLGTLNRKLLGFGAFGKVRSSAESPSSCMLSSLGLGRWLGLGLRRTACHCPRMSCLRRVEMFWRRINSCSSNQRAC